MLQCNAPSRHHESWKYCKCPKCGNDAVRETDTMDTFVQSSWYFIRYISDFKDHKFDYQSIEKWFPIDYYIGGAEHAIAHMIYSRFFWRVFKKMGYIPTDSPTEPFKKVITQVYDYKRRFKITLEQALEVAYSRKLKK